MIVSDKTSEEFYANMIFDYLFSYIAPVRLSTRSKQGKLVVVVRKNQANFQKLQYTH